MSKRNPVWQKESGKLYVKPAAGARHRVGKIEGDTLYVTDKDNWHISSNSLGIDEDVIESPELKYNYIAVLFKGNQLVTTRYYFWRKSKPQELYNGRKMKFLEIPRFGIEKALAVEKDEYLNKIGQYNIFDIAEMEAKGEKGPRGIRLLEYYEKALEKVSEELEKINNRKSKTRRII